MRNVIILAIGLLIMLFAYGCENLGENVQEPIEPDTEVEQVDYQDIPENILSRYEELKPIYEDSLGSNIQSCTKEDEMIYTVSGSGGFTGITLYYDVEGTEIGKYEFGDVIDPETPPQEPPIDIEGYECTIILDSDSEFIDEA